MARRAGVPRGRGFLQPRRLARGQQVLQRDRRKIGYRCEEHGSVEDSAREVLRDDSRKPPESCLLKPRKGVPMGINSKTQVARLDDIDWGEAWTFHHDSMRAYGEQRYADALEAVRAGLQHTPDHPGLHYNYACFATLAGDTSDETFDHLRRSVELLPRFREEARTDHDLAAILNDPRFDEALS